MPNESSADFLALHNLGLARAQAGDFATAARHLSDAVEVNPGSAEAFLHLANVRMAVGQTREALAAYEQALALKPQFPEALYGRGNALQALAHHDEAVASYDHVLAAVPDRPEVLANRGNALHDLGRFEEALASYDRALAVLPTAAMLHNNRANTLRVLRRHGEALASLATALRIEPDYVDAFINRGYVLQDIGRYEDALACFDKVLALDPNHLSALNDRASVLAGGLKRHEEAVAAAARLLELAPDWDYAQGLLLQSQLQSCDWTRHEENAARVVRKVREGRKADIPFSFLAVSGSAADQLQCARSHAADKYPARGPLWNGEAYAHDRIRVAYVSADFREHPVSYLMAGVFARHDRERFDITGISLRPDDGTPAGRGVRAALGNVVDVFGKSDAEIAALLRGMEIDIAVDLMGCTDGARSAVFAQRPAPVQVNYLGYPGTCGAPYMDYLIADRIVVPPAHQAHYSERIVWMPDSFQANDDERRIGAVKPARPAMGLPETGFVFCCFNNSYKITPAFFERWLALLQAVAGSVLWLFAEQPVAARNLREEARRRGVDPARLVFAGRLPYADHLARLQLADLFLDTLPFNAGTTASDALWAGVPVLTCPGDAFASRMAASLLTAAGLPEIIAANPGDYSALALRLATTPSLLAELRERLARNRTHCALFDTRRFCRNLESAYRAMWERSRRGDAAVSFEVESGRP